MCLHAEADVTMRPAMVLDEREHPVLMGQKCKEGDILCAV